MAELKNNGKSKQDPRNIVGVEIKSSHTSAKARRDVSLKLLKFVANNKDASPYELKLEGNELVVCREIDDIDYYVVIKNMHSIEKSGVKAENGLYKIANNINDIIGRSLPNKCLVDILYYKEMEELEELYTIAVRALDIPVFNAQEVPNWQLGKNTIKTVPDKISTVTSNENDVSVEYTEGVGLRKSALKNCLFIDATPGAFKLDVVGTIVATIIDSTNRVRGEMDKFLFSLNLSPYTFRGCGFIRDIWSAGAGTSHITSELDDIFVNVIDNVYGINFYDWYDENYTDGEKLLSTRKAVFRGVSVIPYLEKAIDGKNLLPSFLFDSATEKGDYLKSFNVAVEVAQRHNGKELANSFFMASYLMNKFKVDTFEGMAMRAEFTHSFVSFLMTLNVSPEDMETENVSYKKSTSINNTGRYYHY